MDLVRTVIWVAGTYFVLGCALFLYAWVCTDGYRPARFWMVAPDVAILCFVLAMLLIGVAGVLAIGLVAVEMPA